MKNFQKNNDGFSLIEMLLTVFILTGLLIAAFNVIKNYGENVLAKSNATYLSQINQAAYDIIKNPTYFNAIYSLGRLELTLEDIRDGFMVGAIPIPASSIIANNFANFTPYKTGVYIIYRVADSGAPGSVDALEILVSTDERVDSNRVIKSASYMDMNGGYYLNIADGVKNAFGAWDFSPNQYNGTAWNVEVSSNPPSLAAGGYIVSYRHVTFDDVSGDYLFRTRVAGRPELNQMRTNLNLGGYNILNADDINATGTMTLSSGAVVKGSILLGSSLTTGTATFNRSNFYAGNTLQANNARIDGQGTGIRGNLNVDGAIQSTNLNVNRSIDSNSATFQGGLTTNQTINVEKISNITDIYTNNVNTETFTGGSGANRPSIIINNTLKTGKLETGQLSISGTGNTGMLDLSLSGNLNANNIRSPTVVIQSINVGTFGACDKGC